MKVDHNRKQTVDTCFLHIARYSFIATSFSRLYGFIASRLSFQSTSHVLFSPTENEPRGAVETALGLVHRSHELPVVRHVVPNVHPLPYLADARLHSLVQRTHSVSPLSHAYVRTSCPATRLRRRPCASEDSCRCRRGPAPGRRTRPRVSCRKTRNSPGCNAHFSPTALQ